MSIYLDNAATTPVNAKVLQEMLPYFSDIYANSHSQHSQGQKAESAVDKARLQVSNALNAKSNEIYFTASGTEANNWAIKGIAFARENKGKHIIVSSIEHPSIINSAKQLEANGFEITFLPVNSDGVVTVELLNQYLRKDTILVSIMAANNEMGSIQPIEQLTKIVHDNGSIMHIDAVQAIGAMEIDVVKLGVDLLSISAHKFYGPKGIGALYIRNGLKIDKLIVGGGQERSMRGGTTNTPAVVGMGLAIEMAMSNKIEYIKHCSMLRDYMIERVYAEIPYVKLNGHPTNRLPNNVNFSFQYIEGESLLMLLDMVGVSVSSGSACSSGSLEPSHVMMAMNVPIGLAHGSIRFSFSTNNTLQEVDFVVEKLKEIVSKLRTMSPLFSLREGEIKNV